MTADGSVASFRAFAEAAHAIVAARSADAKVRRAAAYLRPLRGRPLGLATRFLGEGAFPQRDPRTVSLGGSTVGRAAATFCAIDYDRVFRPCREATGSTNETTARLFANIEAARARTAPAYLTLADIEGVYERLAETRRAVDKEALLHEVWAAMTALEVQYFLCVAGGGTPRIGMSTRSVLCAIAAAFEAPVAEVRLAHQLTGCLECVAVLAADGRLGDARAELFTPLPFMMAAPLEACAVPPSLPDYVAEEKLGGIRCQAHIDAGVVRLFSGDLSDITSSFPDIVAHLAETPWQGTVLDGAIIVLEDDTIQPFERLQQRLLSRPTAALLNEHPARLVGFDLLIGDHGALFDEPLAARRAALGALVRCTPHVFTTVQHAVPDAEALDALYLRARRHGNEGLVLKRKGSTYDYGQRDRAWLQVKEPGGKLDTVLLYAHRGSGRRGERRYSDFTLGIRVADDDRYAEDFIPIGKADGGYAEAEQARLNREVRRLREERFGPTLRLRPAVVVTVEFDEVEVNRRTKAGFTLRRPRFKVIRWDLGPNDADTLSDVEHLWAHQQGRTRERQAGTALAQPGGG